MFALRSQRRGGGHLVGEIIMQGAAATRPRAHARPVVSGPRIAASASSWERVWSCGAAGQGWGQSGWQGRPCGASFPGGRTSVRLGPWPWVRGGHWVANCGGDRASTKFSGLCFPFLLPTLPRQAGVGGRGTCISWSRSSRGGTHGPQTPGQDRPLADLRGGRPWCPWAGRVSGGRSGPAICLGRERGMPRETAPPRAPPALVKGSRGMARLTAPCMPACVHIIGPQSLTCGRPIP